MEPLPCDRMRMEVHHMQQGAPNTKNILDDRDHLVQLERTVSRHSSLKINIDCFWLLLQY